MEKFVYTIIYFRNGEFFMISANAFKSKADARRCAGKFCEGRANECDLWTYDIDKLIVR